VKSTEQGGPKIPRINADSHRVRWQLPTKKICAHLRNLRIRTSHWCFARLCACLDRGRFRL